MVTTRSGGNAAYIDLATSRVVPLGNVRSGCQNNLVPAEGLLNVPNVTGGCECNYLPASLAAGATDGTGAVQPACLSRTG